jgi:hypothetical protein
MAHTKGYAAFLMLPIHNFWSYLWTDSESPLRRCLVESQYASVAYVNFLFGIFCAYWAQVTYRSAWLWFFMGLLFGPITGVVLASKNVDHRKTRQVA